MFFPTKHAGTGLVVDGLAWGAAVGALLTLPWLFLLGIGPLFGAAVGGGTGLVAGLFFELWWRLHLPPAALAAATIVPTLVVVYVVSSATIGFGVEPVAAPAVDPGGVLYCGLAAVPLAIDVLRRATGHHRRRPAHAVGVPA